MSDAVSKILVVDDHQLVLDGIVSIFTEEHSVEVTGTASNGEEALKFLKWAKVDVVLTDIDMPKMGGIELVKRIKQEGIEVKILVLSMHNEKSIIQEVMNIGADGYLLKTSSKEEMTKAVKDVLDGKKSFSSDVTLTLLSSTEVENKSDELFTSREIEILNLISEGLSNKEIGERLFISHRTVDTHRTNMMKKVDVKNIAGLIRYGFQHGLIE